MSNRKFQDSHVYKSQVLPSELGEWHPTFVGKNNEFRKEFAVALSSI